MTHPPVVTIEYIDHNGDLFMDAYEAERWVSRIIYFERNGLSYVEHWMLTVNQGWCLKVDVYRDRRCLKQHSLTGDTSPRSPIQPIFATRCGHE